MLKTYTEKQLRNVIAEAIEWTGYFESDSFYESYLSYCNNGPSQEQIENAEIKALDDCISSIIF